MNLHEIKPAQGATRAQKRVGRGTGSGHGKPPQEAIKGNGPAAAAEYAPVLKAARCP